MQPTEQETPRTVAEINQLRAARGGAWRLIRGIHHRRPVLTALLVLAAPLHALWAGIPPADLLDPRADARFVVPWALMLFGAAIRIWGSGNLRKNQEITTTGVYGMVRHPLYTGSLSMFLAYYLTVGDPALGVLLFLLLVFGVYYPTMLAEEEFLGFKFPVQAAQRERIPRLLPSPLRLGRARESDRFTLRAAYENLGLRSLWFLLGLPVFLRLLAWLQQVV